MAITNADGSIILTTKVDQSGLKRGMSSMKSGVSSLTTSFGKLSAAIGVAFSVATLVKFSKEASNVATTAEASIQRLIDIYGSASQAVGDFIDANANALGMSRSAAANFASVYGNLFSVWADQQTNANLTNKYLQTTAVVASKTGRTVEDVQERIRSGLLGNTEAIEDLGIFVNIKTIEMTDAFQRMADGKSWEQLDAYTQQQIRATAILEQAIEKYGTEVAETSALAKSQFQAAWQDFQATWGQVINRVLIPVLDVLTEILLTATEAMQAIFNISSATISQGDAIENATENQDELTDAIKGTEKANKKVLAGFDDLQILSSTITQETNKSPTLDIFGDFETIEKSESTVSKIFDGIAQKIKDAWSSEPVQSFWSTAQTLGQTGLYAFQTIGTSLWKNLQQTWTDIEDDFDSMCQDINDLWIDFWEDLELAVDEHGQPLVDSVDGEMNDVWNTAFNPYVNLMAGAWADFTAMLKNLWYRDGAETLNNIGNFARNAVALFQSIYDNVLEPIIVPLLNTMSWLWEEHLSGTVEKVMNFVSTLVNGALKLYNEFIHPIVTWLLEYWAPVWSFFTNFVIGSMGSVIAAIVDVVGGIFDTLSGLIDFVVGVFTLDWEQALTGIKTFFKGIFDSFVGLVKAPINLVIDVLNAFIAGLNKISFDLPDWEILGDWAGKQFGMNIDKIPKLAQGAVIPPNREFLAVLGDQKQGTNIETPLSTMVQAFQMALDSRGGTGSTEVVLEIDGREFGRAVVEQGNKENRRIGTRLVVI